MIWLFAFLKTSQWKVEKSKHRYSIQDTSKDSLARSSGIAGKAGIASGDVSVQLCKQLWELKEDRSQTAEVVGDLCVCLFRKTEPGYDTSGKE